MHQVARQRHLTASHNLPSGRVLQIAGPDVLSLTQAAGVEVTSRGMQRALLALHAALAVAPESLAAAMGRTPAPDATPALQVT